MGALGHGGRGGGARGRAVDGRAAKDLAQGLGDGHALGGTLLVGVEELDLLVVEGALPLGADKVDGVQRLHAPLNEGDGNHDRSPPESCHAVHGNGVRFSRGLLGLLNLLQQVKPLVQDAGRRILTIRESHLVDGDTIGVEGGGGVGGLADADQVPAAVVLERLHI